MQTLADYRICNRPFRFETADRKIMRISRKGQFVYLLQDVSVAHVEEKLQKEYCQ
jgi:hypothetical protein